MYDEQDIPFVFEDGVLRPEGPVDLPAGARGIAHIRLADNGSHAAWQDHTIEQLRIEQGVKPLSELSELAGDWPEEDSIDEFLDFIRRGRH